MSARESVSPSVSLSQHPWGFIMASSQFSVYSFIYYDLFLLLLSSLSQIYNENVICTSQNSIANRVVSENFGQETHKKTNGCHYSSLEVATSAVRVSFFLIFFCPFFSTRFITSFPCQLFRRSALWPITAKNIDCSTGPLARLFARSLAPLTRSWEKE